jgi:hypothetical protein
MHSAPACYVLQRDAENLGLGFGRCDLELLSEVCCRAVRLVLAAVKLAARLLVFSN